MIVVWLWTMNECQCVLCNLSLNRYEGNFSVGVCVRRELLDSKKTTWMMNACTPIRLPYYVLMGDIENEWWLAASLEEGLLCSKVLEGVNLANIFVQIRHATPIPFILLDWSKSSGRSSANVMNPGSNVRALDSPFAYNSANAHAAQTPWIPDRDAHARFGIYSYQLQCTCSANAMNSWSGSAHARFAFSGAIVEISMASAKLTKREFHMIGVAGNPPWRS